MTHVNGSAPPTCQVAAPAAHSAQLLAIRQIRTSLRTVLKRSNTIRAAARLSAPTLPVHQGRGPDCKPRRPLPLSTPRNAQLRYQQHFPSHPGASQPQPASGNSSLPTAQRELSARRAPKIPSYTPPRPPPAPRLATPLGTVESEARNAGPDEGRPGQTMSVET